MLVPTISIPSHPTDSSSISTIHQRGCTMRLWGYLSLCSPCWLCCQCSLVSCQRLLFCYVVSLCHAGTACYAVSSRHDVSGCHASVLSCMLPVFAANDCYASPPASVCYTVSFATPCSQRSCYAAVTLPRMLPVFVMLLILVMLAVPSVFAMLLVFKYYAHNVAMLLAMLPCFRV